MFIILKTDYRLLENYAYSTVPLIKNIFDV